MSRIKFRVRSVIFDMDGVITNTMPEHFRTWRSIFLREGIHVSYEDIYKREGQPGLSSVTEIFKEHGKELSHQKAKAILKKKEVLFKRMVKTRFIPGARSFLKRLHKEQISLALVTGTSRHELNRILPPNVRALFSVIVTGNDVRNGKPHPEPYRRCLKKLKVKSAHAVVIENAPFGIRSAKRAGLHCLALSTSLPPRYLHEADMVFSSVKELQDRTQFIAERSNMQRKPSWN